METCVEPHLLRATLEHKQRARELLSLSKPAQLREAPPAHGQKKLAHLYGVCTHLLYQRRKGRCSIYHTFLSAESRKIIIPLFGEIKRGNWFRINRTFLLLCLCWYFHLFELHSCRCRSMQSQWLWGIEKRLGWLQNSKDTMNKYDTPFLPFLIELSQQQSQRRCSHQHEQVCRSTNRCLADSMMNAYVRQTYISPHCEILRRHQYMHLVLPSFPPSAASPTKYTG